MEVYMCIYAHIHTPSILPIIPSTCSYCSDKMRLQYCFVKTHMVCTYTLLSS